MRLMVSRFWNVGFRKSEFQGFWVLKIWDMASEGSGVRVATGLGPAEIRGLGSGDGHGSGLHGL